MNSEKTDLELIQAFTGGDASAFNLLAARYQDRIYWHARRMTGNHLDADDIMQEVLLVMYKKLKDFRFQSSVYTWVYKITATRSLNYLRRQKVRRFFSLDDEENPVEVSSAEDVLHDLGMRESARQAERLLKQLPPKQREVFILRNYEQLSYEEISKITGTSTGALKANYFHAVEKLQKLMNRNE